MDIIGLAGNIIPGIQYNCGYEREKSYFSDESSTHIQSINFLKYNKRLNINEDVYISVTIDGENLVQNIYINGTKLDGGFVSEKYWKSFIENDLPELNTICLGRSSMEAEGWWHYSKMDLYSLRLYNRALSDEEVMENYNSTVLYHNIITE